jgi:hypothetical protein
MSFGNDPEKLKELRGIDDDEEEEKIDRHEKQREKESQRRWQRQFDSEE